MNLLQQGRRSRWRQNLPTPFFGRYGNPIQIREQFLPTTLKLGFSEKYTKFEKIFLMDLTNQLIYLVNIKTTRKFFSNYVCFSENSNFTCCKFTFNCGDLPIVIFRRIIFFLPLLFFLPFRRRFTKNIIRIGKNLAQRTNALCRKFLILLLWEIILLLLKVR